MTEEGKWGEMTRHEQLVWESRGTATFRASTNPQLRNSERHRHSPVDVQLYARKAGWMLLPHLPAR